LVSSDISAGGDLTAPHVTLIVISANVAIMTFHGLHIFIAAVLLGLKEAMAVGLLAIVILAFTAHATYLAYAGTAIAIALTAYYLQRFGYFKNLPATIVGGLLIGVVAATVSAPVTAYLFGGVTLSGLDSLIVFFKQTGHNILKSTILAGISTDPIDKMITSIIAYYLLKTIPESIKLQLRGNNGD